VAKKGEEGMGRPKNWANPRGEVDVILDVNRSERQGLHSWGEGVVGAANERGRSKSGWGSWRTPTTEGGKNQPKENAAS